MSAARRTVRVLRGGGHGWTLLTVAVGWLLISGFRVVLPALLPQVRGEFAVGNAGAGFALTVLWLTYAGMQFPAGVVADRIGERTFLVGGAFLATLGLVGLYAAPVFAVFLLAAAGFGVGAGLFGTPRDMLLSRTYPDADNTAYAVIFAAGSLGAAALPFLATVIAGRVGWRLGVAWLVPLYLVVGVGLWRSVPARGPSATGAGDPSLRRTVRRTARALTDRRVVLAGASMVLFVFTYQALVSFLPTYLVETKGLAQGVAAGLFGLLFVFGAAVQPLAGRVADRHGGRTTLLGLVALSTGTLALLPFTGGRPALAVLVPLLGIRIAVGPLTSAFIVRDLPEPVRGTGWGLLRTAFFALGATGSSVMGLFADAGLFDAGFLVLAALTGLVGVLWLFVPPAGN